MTSAPNGWTDLTTIPMQSPFSIEVPYPQPIANIRLVIDGNSTYATYTKASINAAVVEDNVVPNVPVAVNNNLNGGQAHDFNFSAVAGRSYSVHVSDLDPFTNPDAWTFTGPSGPVRLTNDNAVYLFEATETGPSTISYNVDFEATLDDVNVTIRETLERINNEAGVGTVANVGPDQWVRFSVPIDDCTNRAFVMFTVSTGLLDPSFYMLISPLGGVSSSPTLTSGEPFLYSCEVGTYELFVRRSRTESGFVSMSHTFLTPP